MLVAIVVVPVVVVVVVGLVALVVVVAVVVEQQQLASGTGLKKWRSVPPYVSYGFGRILKFASFDNRFALATNIVLFLTSKTSYRRHRMHVANAILICAVIQNPAVKKDRKLVIKEITLHFTDFTFALGGI